MSIAIIIATHGVAAEQLLKTTEMLIGEQEDVAYIDFVPGENAETIMGKYQALVEGPLSHCDQVLFLVDMWGGSPFQRRKPIPRWKIGYGCCCGCEYSYVSEHLYGS